MDDTLARNPGRASRRVWHFVETESGAVTVDWVVLTAAITMMGIAAGFSVSAGVPVLADKMSGYLESQTVVPD